MTESSFAQRPNIGNKSDREPHYSEKKKWRRKTETRKGDKQADTSPNTDDLKSIQNFGSEI